MTPQKKLHITMALALVIGFANTIFESVVSVEDLPVAIHNSQIRKEIASFLKAVPVAVIVLMIIPGNLN